MLNYRSRHNITMYYDHTQAPSHTESEQVCIYSNVLHAMRLADV